MSSLLRIPIRSDWTQNRLKRSHMEHVMHPQIKRSLVCIWRSCAVTITARAMTHATCKCNWRRLLMLDEWQRFTVSSSEMKEPFSFTSGVFHATPNDLLAPCFQTWCFFSPLYRIPHSDFICVRRFGPFSLTSQFRLPSLAHEGYLSQACNR